MAKTTKDNSREIVQKALETHEKQQKKTKTSRKVTKKAPKTQQTTVRRKAGRPSKYKKEYADTLIDNMAEGLSFEACCGILDICKDTGYEWIKKHPEFADAKKRGERLSQLWWEQQGMKGMFWGAKDFNATIWIFAMKNRSDWRDNKDLNIGGQPGNPLNAQGPLGAIIDELEGLEDEELDIEIEKILERRKHK